MLALTILIVLDYITGIIKAIKQNKISSKIGLFGITKKICIYIIIATAYAVQPSLGLDYIVPLSILFYSLNEATSILENCAEIGIPIPNRILKILEKMKDEVDKENETDD